MAQTTPETTIQVRRVGFLPRLAAYIIDVIVTGLIVGVIGGSFWAVTRATGTALEAGTAMLPLTALAVLFVYYTMLHAKGNQTVGKWVIGAVVMDTDLCPIGYGRSLARLLAEFISTIPFYLGYLWALGDRERQAWHDKLASTLVVRKADLADRAAR